jgi:hypothetical protein
MYLTEHRYHDTSSGRQAGAQFSAKKRKQSDFAAFGFNRDDYAISFVSEHREQISRGAFWEGFDICQRYVNCKLAVVLKILSLADAGEFDVVFNRVPAAGEKLDGAIPIPSLDAEIGSSSGDECYQSVFAGVAQIVEDAKKIVPSRVRLESSKERLDFRRTILGNSLYAIIEFESITRKRENSEICVQWSSGEHGGGKRRVVEAARRCSTISVAITLQAGGKRSLNWIL